MAKGADVNVRDKYGRSALDFLGIKGDISIISLLEKATSSSPAEEVYRQNAGDAAYSVIDANKGATDKCLKILEGLMGE